MDATASALCANVSLPRTRRIALNARATMTSNTLPTTILVLDENEGAILATLAFLDQVDAHPVRYVYRQTAYYHSLADALADLNGERPRCST